MSHSVVPMYVTRERRDISRTWMRLLSFVQGMNPQKRETGIHIEKENDNMHLLFVLGHSIANIHSLLVGGAFAASSHEESEEETFFNTYKQQFDDQDSLRHAKVGRISQECSVSSVTRRNLDHSSMFADTRSDNFSVPSSVFWLTYECLRAIENWLEMDNTTGPLLSALSPKLGNISGNNFFALKRTLSKFRRGRYMFRSSNMPSASSKITSSGEVFGKQYSSTSRSGFNMEVDLESSRNLRQEAGTGGSDDSSMEGVYATELEALRLLSLSDWPDMVYDVSSQDISAHIPLHQLLSVVLQISLGNCYGESALPNVLSATRLSLDELPGHNCRQEGNMQHILESSETGAQYPDNQLWKRASDPVLAHDAFSSLMWILFCLPSPFLSCEESFLCLVHLFYVVTVTQAIVVYYRKQQLIITELEYKDCLITDICKVMGEYEIALQYFDSHYIDASFDIKDAIRSLSFPYLRRCALLWRLINSSTSLPFTNGNYAPYG